MPERLSPTTASWGLAAGQGKLADQTFLGRVGRRFLEHPLSSWLDPDDPKTKELRKKILASKPFLRAIYDEWYSKLSAEVPAGTGAVLELGSGAGYGEQFIPEVVKSELIQCSGAQIVADAQRLPLADATLLAILPLRYLLSGGWDAKLDAGVHARVLGGSGTVARRLPTTAGDVRARDGAKKNERHSYQ
jgi:hypothetical protein